MRRLVLFDIDGTLLTAGGAGRRAIGRAIEEVFGSLERHVSATSFAGKTDPQICREVLRQAGLAGATIEGQMPRLFDLYLGYLAEALPHSSSCRVLPGVVPLLEALVATQHVCLGLLTGNIERGAAIKLGHFGLADYFAVGAYGSDHADRHQLPAIAVERALARDGHRHTGKQIVIIGDTEHDIACGRSVGARAIAVATGSFGADALRPHAPDHLFTDLSDTAGVLAAILD